MNVKVGCCLAALITSCSKTDEDSLVDCSTVDNNLMLTNLMNPTCLIPGAVQVTGGNISEYTFSLNGSSFLGDPVFKDLEVGSYTITAKSSAECETLLTFELIEEDKLSVALDIANAECGLSDGGISVIATGGTGNYSYSIDGNNFQSSATFISLTPDSYTVFLQDDSGCMTSETADVTYNISLAEDVMPIISNNCAVSGCHMDAQSPLLNSAEEIIEQAGRINIRAQGLQEGAQSMPPSGLIAEDLQEQIACWVLAGSLNN